MAISHSDPSLLEASSLEASSGETFTKEEAAQFLGVSSRALERYTAAGRVAVGYQRGKTRSVAVYERAELERLKSELQRPLLRGASAETSAPFAAELQTPTTATKPLVSTEDETIDSDGQRPQTPSNSDKEAGQVSEFAVAVSSEAAAGGAGHSEAALDALAQLVLQRLLDRAHGATTSAKAESFSGSGAPGSALVLAPVQPVLARTPHAALGEKLLLSLPEAAALTGLSRAFLKTAIHDGALVAKPIGRLWRVKRADLDAFVAAL